MKVECRKCPIWRMCYRTRKLMLGDNKPNATKEHQCPIVREIAIDDSGKWRLSTS